MGISDRNIILCYGIPEENIENEITLREYYVNNCFDNFKHIFYSYCDTLSSKTSSYDH